MLETSECSFASGVHGGLFGVLWKRRTWGRDQPLPPALHEPREGDA
jgi:hypothetical protein